MACFLLLHYFSEWGPFVFVRDSKYGMPVVQSFHLMGLTILLATVLLLNLRLIGLGGKDYDLSWLAKRLKPWTWGAFSVVLASGLLMFFATPGKYLDNRSFRVKMALLLLAVLFHLGVVRRFTATGSAPRSRLANVLVACLSLTLWFGVGWAGRAIAFIP